MAKRTLMAIKDQLHSAAELEKLRIALNSIPNIADANFRMDNRVQMRGDKFLITDLVIEVDDPFAEQVRQSIRASGFELCANPLFEKPGVRESVRALVEAHRRDNPESRLRYAIWFRLEDPRDVHLLEIADGVFDPGDASLEGLALSAGDEIPGARSIIVYLASPREFAKACSVNPGHPAVIAVREQRCWLVFPEGGWDQFHQEFPGSVTVAA